MNIVISGILKCKFIAELLVATNSKWGAFIGMLLRPTIVLERKI